MPAPYDAYAPIYDRAGQSRFSLRMIGYARELWELEGAEVSTVLELACGTGSAAVALARRGFGVTAVDRSAAMLGLARAKAERWKAPVRFVEQDLRALDAGGPFDAATCFYDSVNYFLVPSELQAALARVRMHLKPGGLFLFDAITDHAVASVWGNETELKVAPDYVRIWRASYRPVERVGALEVDYFVPEGPDGLYRRVSETHLHRGYSVFEMRELLEAAGFELVSTYKCLSLEPVTPRTYRVAYLARAPRG